MPAEITNLRHARKSKARGEKENRASENRAKFGRTKEERKFSAADKARINKELDGAKIDDVQVAGKQSLKNCEGQNDG